MTATEHELQGNEAYVAGEDYCRAIASISAVKARYFRFVDTKQWEQLAGLFTDDAQFFFPEVRSAPFDKAEILSLIIESLHDSVSIHHGHVPEIQLTSPTTACAIWPMEDRILYSASASARHGLAEMHGYGHYHEKYVIGPSGWMICELKLTRLHKIEISLDPPGAPSLRTQNFGQRG